MFAFSNMAKAWTEYSGTFSSPENYVTFCKKSQGKSHLFS